MLHQQYPWAQGQDAWGGTYTRLRIVDSSRSMPVNFTENVGMERRISCVGVRDLLTERGEKGTLGKFPGGLVIRIPGF